MNLERLKYIKNVSDQSDQENGWAYDNFPKGSYFALNFRQGEGVEAHAMKFCKGEQILLSQSNQGKRYLSHVVEIVNELSEDQLLWQDAEWGIVRWVKVIWAGGRDSSPLDADVLDANWGYYDTKAKLLDSPNLMMRWENLDALRTHIRTALLEF